MNNIKEVLKNSGLNENEVRIYLALLKLGQSKIGTITKEINLHKSSCYNSIDTLTDKGIVSSVKIGEISYFYAENPKTLVSFIEEKKKNIERILSKLEKTFKEKKDKSIVKHFKGKKGIKAVFHDILKDGKDNDVFGSEGQLSDNLSIFSKQYIRIQNEKQIKTRNLIGEGRKRPYSKGTSYKFIDKKFKSNVVTNIYGDKIAIIIWSDKPEAIIIENKIAAKSYHSYFEYMWKHAIKPKTTIKK